MPDLGSYAVEVMSAYAVSITLLVAVVALSFVQSRRARRALDEAEGRARDA